MHFTIASQRWTVVVVSDLIWDGDRCLGLVDSGPRRIMLDAEQVAADRLETLMHELWHIVEWATGVTRDDDDVEARCDRFATWAAHFYLELAEQGGLPALLAMRPAAEECSEIRRLRRELALAVQRATTRELADAS